MLNPESRLELETSRLGEIPTSISDLTHSGVFFPQEIGDKNTLDMESGLVES